MLFDNIIALIVFISLALKCYNYLNLQYFSKQIVILKLRKLLTKKKHLTNRLQTCFLKFFYSYDKFT